MPDKFSFFYSDMLLEQTARARFHVSCLLTQHKSQSVGEVEKCIERKITDFRCSVCRTQDLTKVEPDHGSCHTSVFVAASSGMLIFALVTVARLYIPQDNFFTDVFGTCSRVNLYSVPNLTVRWKQRAR